MQNQAQEYFFPTKFKMGYGIESRAKHNDHYGASKRRRANWLTAPQKKTFMAPMCLLGQRFNYL